MTNKEVLHLLDHAQIQELMQCIIIFMKYVVSSQYAMDMNLGKLMRDREAWHAAVINNQPQLGN